MHGSCPIYLEDFTCTGLVVTRMRSTIRPCNHTLHSKCLIVWLQEYARCPISKVKLFPIMVLVNWVMCERRHANGEGFEILTIEEVWEQGQDLDEKGVRRFRGL
jgi:hypothetical protein